MSKAELNNKEELLKKISKELYNDEWFIEKAIISYKAQQEKTYTFFKDNSADNFFYKFNWCQRPCDTNMSLHHFDKNANVCAWMSESLAERHGLEQITLTDFIYNFVKPLIENNIKLKDILENGVHYINCKNCGKEIRTKRKQKYCDNCRVLIKKEQEKEWYKNLSEEKKNERKEKARNKMRELRNNLNKEKDKNIKEYQHKYYLEVTKLKRQEETKRNRRIKR